MRANFSTLSILQDEKTSITLLLVKQILKLRQQEVRRKAESESVGIIFKISKMKNSLILVIGGMLLCVHSFGQTSAHRKPSKKSALLKPRHFLI